MSDNYTNTLAGLLLLNDANMRDIYPTNVLDDAPVIKAAHAQPASQGGTQHKYLRRMTAAGAGFRKIATGIDNAAEQFTDITVNCEILDGSFDRDVAEAKAYRKGVDAYLQRETGASLGSMFFALERALFNIGIATSFKGLPYMDDYLSTAGSQVVDVGGSGGKSVWMLRWAEDAVSVIAGNEGNMELIVPTEDNIVRVLDPATRPYSAYRTTLLGWFALQVGSTYDAVRICNLDGTSGKTLTDDMLYDALSRFPSGRQPNMIVMNRTALKELREARTGTNPTGTPAPRPTDLEGIPIVTTEALVSDETTVDESAASSVTTGTTTVTTTSS
jgi:hypothetical protein